MTKKKKMLPKAKREWIEYFLLGTLVIGAFLLRTIPSWDKILIDGKILFRGVDAWYHIRLAENMMVNFPTPLKWDMFALYPGGAPVGYYPLMSWLIAIPGQVFNYEVVGAFLPPILGAFTLIPVFYIGKVLFNKWVGLFSCLLIAILPTEFFHRSMLGFADHHILEVLFSASTILFLILLHKEGKLRYSILAGVFLGLYLSSWSGGLLLVPPILVWFLLTSIYNLSKGVSIESSCKHMTITFFISSLIFLPNVFLVIGAGPSIFFLTLTTLIPPSFLFLSKYFKEWAKFTIIVEGSIILAIGFCAIYYPQIFQTIKGVLPGFGTTIQEAIPSTPKVLISCYGVSFLLFLGGLIFSIKNKENLLLILWTSFMLLLVLGQRRWGYYFAINNAIMASYFIYLISNWVGKNTRVAVVVVVCLFILIPTIKSTVAISSLPIHITLGWHDACMFLRESTPTGDSNYYGLTSKGLEYGVLSWWDYGNWIITIGHRAPLSNPMYQDPPIQGEVFIAQTEEEANKKLEESEIRYIIVDKDMVEGKFYAIVGKSLYLEDPIKLRENSFIFRLWNEETTTWKKIIQFEEVKIYERR